MRQVLALALLLTASGPSVAAAPVAAAVVAVVAATPLAAGPAAPWLWPVDSPRIVDRPFLAPATPYSVGHRGVDLHVAAGAGAAVRAPAAGVVHFAGVVVDRPVLSIRHPGGLISSYEPVASSLVAGEPVSAGEVIGTVTGTGHCPRVCLHLGVRVDGEYVSPMRYLGVLPRAVLLPTRPIR
ncbi:M23 family metallopeptidase [Salinibacterium sp. ZJ450]|uniref:M23 family metallopeptidase n=1 Tax=Salinibacterium sp. ZJ450 TaxID=2708338 RepID=UPI001423C016|nr:M23 family metallopeptidase [Salinibacterium sp. ZJ450]